MQNADTETLPSSHLGLVLDGRTGIWETKTTEQLLEGPSKAFIPIESPPDPQLEAPPELRGSLELATAPENGGLHPGFQQAGSGPGAHPGDFLSQSPSSAQILCQLWGCVCLVGVL